MFFHLNQTALIGHVSTMEAKKYNISNLFHIVTWLIAILKMRIGKALCKCLNAVLENAVYSFFYKVSEVFSILLCVKNSFINLLLQLNECFGFRTF